MRAWTLKPFELYAFERMLGHLAVIGCCGAVPQMVHSAGSVDTERMLPLVWIA